MRVPSLLTERASPGRLFSFSPQIVRGLWPPRSRPPAAACVPSRRRPTTRSGALSPKCKRCDQSKDRRKQKPSFLGKSDLWQRGKKTRRGLPRPVTGSYRDIYCAIREAYINRNKKRFLDGDCSGASVRVRILRPGHARSKAIRGSRQDRGFFIASVEMLQHATEPGRLAARSRTVFCPRGRTYTRLAASSRSRRPPARWRRTSTLIRWVREVPTSSRRASRRTAGASAGIVQHETIWCRGRPVDRRAVAALRPASSKRRRRCR